MSGEVRVGYTVREANLRLLQEPAWAGRLEAGEIARTND